MPKRKLKARSAHIVQDSAAQSETSEAIPVKWQRLATPEASEGEGPGPGRKPNDYAPAHNPRHVFYICHTGSTSIWGNQAPMAGYLGLTDSTELMRLLADSEILTIMDAYLREKRRSFNHTQYIANGLPGKGTQDKVADLHLPSIHIQSAPLYKVP